MKIFERKSDILVDFYPCYASSYFQQKSFGVFFSNAEITRCIKDIEMARANGYSKRLVSKSYECEIQCLEKIKKRFDSDEKFLCMANVLEIKLKMKNT